jgi:hypothetical protein
MVQWSAITVNIKISIRKSAITVKIKIFNQKISYWYNDIFIIATVIFIWDMNQWHHFQISYFVKNQNVMQQSVTCSYNILFVSR